MGKSLFNSNLEKYQVEQIGKIAGRNIFYSPIREKEDWFFALPKGNWLAFTIADKVDKTILIASIGKILDANVSYIVCSGKYGSMTENFFDEEIAWREVQFTEATGKEVNDDTLMTTAHQNFEEGFWFASTVANDQGKEIDSVVCLDFTQKKVKQHLLDLVEKINDGGLPSDQEFLFAKYDN